jgi:HAD superfamily hydrolase (TIGR01509 family)
MDSEVQNFEESILFFADAFSTHGPGSRRPSMSESALESELGTPSLTPGSSAPSSRASSFASGSSRRPSFASRLSNILMMSAVPEVDVMDQYHAEFEDPSMEDDQEEIQGQFNEKGKMHQLQAWQLEAAAVDRSVQILPGVKRMIESIPAGRYAVATSGAKTYAYGCMTRVGITPPPVTITADDKRLKAGKPAPDPFLLAAKCLGYDAKKCVVFEDSPSGIRAGVASGATVIAVCTSHERSKIENCGAHYIVENMEKVKCEAIDGQLKFTILA